MTLTPRTRLIVAMDMLDRDQALKVADEVKDLVDAFKVNYPLVLSQGLGIVTELSRFGPVICDFKIADIDNTNRLIVEQAVKAGASGVIIHAFVGMDSMEACVKAAGEKDIFVVADMSHPGAKYFITPVSDIMARRAVDVGAKGIIAPGTRPERITQLKRFTEDLLVLTPGIGAQGGSAKKAIEAGADFVIVGRAIYNAESPREAALAILQDMDG